MELEITNINNNVEKYKPFLRLSYAWKALTSKQVILLSKNGDKMNMVQEGFTMKNAGMVMKILGEQIVDAEMGLDTVNDFLKEIK